MSSFTPASALSPPGPTVVPAATEDLAPSGWELGALAILALVVAALLFNDGSAVINWLSPLSLIAILGLANWNLATRAPAALWTPLFAYRAGAIVYFGIGGFLPNIYDAFTLDYVLSAYSYQADEAAKAHLIWLLTTLLMLTAARLCNNAIRSTTDGPEPTHDFPTGLMGAAFFIIGFGAFLGIALPATLGISSILVPGSIVTVLEGMTAGGVFLIAVWVLERGRRGWLVLAVLLTITTLAGLISLNKSMIILPQIMISLAFLMRGFGLSRLVPVVLALGLTFSILQPMIAYSRDVHSRTYGDLTGGTIGERLGYSVAWLEGDRVASPLGETVNPLSRLDYLNVATYAISKYDNRQPADAIQMALISIIPRIIWRDKPQTTAINADLYYELSGQVGSAVSTTVPADIYWNLGWLGIFLLSPLLGVPLMIASRKCYQIVATRDWLMMPFVLVCFRTAIAVDGQFVNSIFAPMVMALILYFGLRMVDQLFFDNGPAARSRRRAVDAMPIRFER